MLPPLPALCWRATSAPSLDMLLPQFAWLASCKLMPVGPSRATPCAPACMESLHQSSRRGALTLLALMPPLILAEAATAAEGIAGRNERVVVPILGDLMGLAGPGAHAMSQTGSALGQLVFYARPCPELRPASANQSVGSLRPALLALFSTSVTRLPTRPQVAR